MIPGSSSAQFFGAAGAAGGAGYEIERSLRFNSSDSAYLSRTPGTAGNRQKWTWAGWVKRATSGETQGLFGNYTDGSNFSAIRIINDYIQFTNQGSGGTNPNVTTPNLLRDPSAWYHIVVALDTTQATSSNRVRVYLNGVQLTTSGTYPDQNADLRVNTASLQQNLGALTNSGEQGLDGYLAECFFIDGQALDPSSFGEFDTNGVWQPIDASGLTFGTNGFHLPFSDNSTAAALGTDTSGNGNDWTPNNLSVVTGGPTSVAAASGALPIHNTTDTYGLVIGSGVRSDSGASSLVLAAPFTTSGSNALTDDEMPTGRTSSSKTLAIAGGSVTSNSSNYKFYGSSASFALGAYYSMTSSDFTFGTGDFTIECWVYNPSTVEGTLFATNLGSLASTTFNSRFYSTGQVDVYTSGVAEYITISGVPNDQWVHLAFCRSGGNTMRVFVNGILRATNTSWTANLADGGNFYINRGRDYNVGSGTREYQDVRVYKGLAKYSGSFNPPRSTQDSTAGAGNDSLVDSPTNYGTDTGAGGEVRGNYATLNPLATGDNITLSNGNLQSSEATVAGHTWTKTTIGMKSGKWYAEITVDSASGVNAIGLTNYPSKHTGWIGADGSAVDQFNMIYYNGSIRQIFDANVVTSNSIPGGQWSVSDVLQIAYDADAGKAWFGINNTWYQANGTSTTVSAVEAGNNATFVNFQYNSEYFFTTDNHDAGFTYNFGQRPFAYTAPSGFKALCTTNLAEPTIADGSTAFDTKSWSRNSTYPRSITGFNFSPDLIWLKNRTSAYDHVLMDAIRGTGTTKWLSSNLTSAEGVDYANANVTSLDANGFTIGSTVGTDILNQSGTATVAWCWDAGSSTVTNNDGSITSQVRANPSAGFSVVTATQPTTANLGCTIGHGLNVAPAMYIVKDRDLSINWGVYHAGLSSPATQALQLSTTSAAFTATNYWKSTSPTSTVLSIGTSIVGEGNDFVVYAFAPVAGYSSFGSYTGNGSADGPFVYTGFRPKFVIFKQISSGTGGEWLMLDSARKTYNFQGPILFSNFNAAESADAEYLDFLSNGFKFRTTNSTFNGSGFVSIYIAFAEHPFATSRAR